MALVADILLMLSSFNIKMQLVAKARVYGHIGVALFPEDLRLREQYVYALMLDGRIEEARDALAGTQSESRNVAYLRARLALQDGADTTAQRDALRSYLKAE